MMFRVRIALLILLVTTGSLSYGQSVDSLSNKVLGFPSRLFDKIRGKTANLDQQLTKQTQRYLQKMASQEQRLKRQLARTDSAGAARLFANSPQQYAAMQQKFRNDTATGKPVAFTGTYQPYADSMGTALRFLQQNPQLLNSTGKEAGLVQGASTQMLDLQAKMQGSTDVQAFVQQRKAMIKQYLSTLTHLPPGLNNAYQGLNTGSYYYAQQVQQYKDMLNNPDAMEKNALAVLSQTGAYQNFMKTNSQLATLFGVPGASGTGQSLAGLQTRDQLQQQVQGQLAAGGSNGMSALTQSLQSAQSQLDQLKDKLSKLGEGGADVDDPNFRPNQQKTKTLLQRLQYGFNLQSTHNSYFPVTTDIGLSLGYRLDNSKTIGIGASYKVGWGSDIGHVAVSSQGIGLRSFVDMKLKGSFYLSGGYEYNLQRPVAGLLPVAYTHVGGPNLGWTESGLLGVSKTVSLQSKYLKNTKLQLLWDFLSYQQVPRTQPILFRVGYGF